MKNRKLIFTLVIVFIAATFNSCIEDPEPIALDVVADVFVQKTLQNGEEKLAPAFWVIANKSLESVTVEGPDGENWDLEEDEASPTVFSLLPNTTQYTDSIPESGDYSFTITSDQIDEAPLTIIDKLENAELGAATIDSVKFNDSELMIAWPLVNDADSYYVRLYNDSDNLMFVSPSIDNNKTQYSFGNTDAGWSNPNSRAIPGESYRIELLAVLYESTSTSANQNQNLQFISLASETIIWEE